MNLLHRGCRTCWGCPGGCAVLLGWVVCASFANVARADAPAAQRIDPSWGAKIHPLLKQAWTQRGEVEQIKAWVFFADKALPSRRAVNTALDDVASKYNRRAVERRRLRRTLPGLFDERDLPVSPAYVAQVKATGARVHVVSRWLNAVSISADREQLQRINNLPFVQKLQPVGRAKRTEPVAVNREAPPVTFKADAAEAGLSYGQSQQQLEQINLVALHDLGFTGSGVVVGILDTGFITTHDAFNNPSKPLNVVAEYDFVDDDPDPRGGQTHGTYILGTLAAYLPGSLVGGAFDASYILCRTEDTFGEYPAEEDFYVGGLEFIEANGGDLATASLSYLTWEPPNTGQSYTQADLDGLTAVTTLGVNVATANGLFCLNAASNGGNDANPSTSRLGAPADAFQVITVGAVDSSGFIASFSSDGPTADGRVKPEVLARGINTRTVDPFNDSGFIGIGGTSLSTPLAAGAVACLIQAHPDWTVAQMRNYLFRTAQDFVVTSTFDSLYVRGYGILDVLAAHGGDCNENGVDDAVDISLGTETDCDGNGLPDVCDLAIPGDERDCNGNAQIDLCEVLLGTSQDCNGNSLPDACDADCSGDGIPDDCEGSAANQDCDGDGVCNGVVIANCAPELPSCADCNANSVPDGCDIALGTSFDLNGNGIPDECVNSPLPAASPHDVRKHRFLSINPNNPQQAAVLKVELLDYTCSVTGRKCTDGSDCRRCVGGTLSGTACDINSDCPDGGTCVISGESCAEQSLPVLLGWVGDPFFPGTGHTPPGTLAARVVDTMPAFRLWSETLVHLADCEIAPVQTYGVSASVDGVNYSEPLLVATTPKPQGKFWGDLVGALSGGIWTAPNYLVNVDDVLAWIAFVTNRTAPHVTVVDLDGEVPNFTINATDLQFVLQGFANRTYPPSSFSNQGGPSGCP